MWRILCCFTLCAPSFVRPVVCAPRRLCAPSFVRPVVCAPRRLCAPSFVLLNSLLLMASLLLLLVATDARAGTYTWTTTDPNTKVVTQSPSFSGGTVVVVTSLHPIGSHQPPPGFTTGSGHYTGGGGCVATTAVPNSTSGSVKVNSPSNPIIATFTWQPAQGQDATTDPPPPAVIVEQDCTASWAQETVTNDATATGSADCGLAGPPPTVTTDSNGNVTGVSSSGTQYSVVAMPGASFSVPAQSGSAYKPSATFTANAGTMGAASGSAGVDYQVQVFPVTVNIVGTYNPVAGDYRALTGQQITANLASPYGLPYGTKVTGYTWSFSNNNPIKSWDPSAPGDGEPTQILPLLPTDYIGFPPIGSSTVSVNPISFYDEVASDTVTVKCAVTISLPDYTTQTVNAMSPQVTFIKPTVTNWDVVTGYVQGVFSKTLNLGGLALVQVPGSQQQGGEAWNNVAINVLPPFYGGQGCFAQLITPDTEVTNDDPTKSIVYANSKQQGLDNAFPYASYTWSVPAVGASADNPGVCFLATTTQQDIRDTIR